MNFRVLILSLACFLCLVPAHSTPLTAGLARAAADVAVAKGAALLTAKAALLKGAAALAVKGAVLGSSALLGALSSKLDAAAEVTKPTSDDSLSAVNLIAGALNKYSKVVELKKQLINNAVEIRQVESTPHLSSLVYEPIVVRDVVEIPVAPEPIVFSPDVDCDDEVRFAPVPMLPPHLYNLGAPIRMPRLLRRGPYPLPHVRRTFGRL